MIAWGRSNQEIPNKDNTNKANPTKLFILDIHSEASEGTYEEWIALIKAHATAKYGEIVQEINREQPLPDPETIIEPAGHASKAVLTRYGIDYKSRYGIYTIKDRKKLPDDRTNPNIPAFFRAIRNSYKQSSIFTDNFLQNALKIKYDEFSNPFIWTDSCNIFMDMIAGLEKVF